MLPGPQNASRRSSAREKVGTWLRQWWGHGIKRWKIWNQEEPGIFILIPEIGGAAVIPPRISASLNG